MRRLVCALAAVSLLGISALRAATRIDDPKAFVTEVYRRFVAAQSSHSDYAAPEDIYTARLAKLVRDDRRKAKGEVGCLDFDFWVNGQDYQISNVNITSTDQGPNRKTVIAKFHNIDKVEEIRFDFRRETGRWFLDEVRSMTDPKWTLSEILKCTP